MESGLWNVNHVEDEYDPAFLDVLESVIIKRPDHARVVALVACAKTKRAVRCAARELYCSTLFKAAAAYAEECADLWFVLSARHGLLRADQLVSPYEETLTAKRAHERTAWAQRVARQIEMSGAIEPSDTVVWLAGNAYSKRLSGLLAARRQRFPLRGMRLGEQAHWLHAHTRRNRPA